MIQIEEKSYTIKEVAEIVQQITGYIGDQSHHNTLTYSASDVYWVIRDLLRYINGRMDGEFVLTAKQKGTWQINYTDQKSGQRRTAEKRRQELRQTTDYLADQKALRRQRATQTATVRPLERILSQK